MRRREKKKVSQDERKGERKEELRLGFKLTIIVFFYLAKI